MGTKTILQKTIENGNHYSLNFIRIINRYVIYKFNTKDKFDQILSEAEFMEEIKEFKDEAEAIKFFEKIYV